MSSNGPEEADFTFDTDELDVQASALRYESLEFRLSKPLVEKVVGIEEYPEGLRESGRILEGYKIPRAV